jgi:SAM-dependent methyltransferase
MSHPSDIYRPEFETRVFAGRPRSVLDVGFGEGAFLRCAYDMGIQVAGVDANAEQVDAMRSSGIAVHRATADVLPFADASFDCVVAERVVHHFPNLEVGLAEMLRVARVGVFIFEPWFDEGIPSQASAAALERWMKAVDRAQGGTNNGPLSAQDFLAALPTKITVDVTHRLVLAAVSIDDMAEKCVAYLAEVEKPGAFGEDLNRLIANARRTGLSSEGAIFVEVRRD